MANAKEAIAGAKDIIAEMIADMADYRKSIRNCTMKQGSLVVKAKMRKQNLYTKCITISESHFLKLRDIGFLRLTVEKRKVPYC